MAPKSDSDESKAKHSDAVSGCIDSLWIAFKLLPERLSSPNMQRQAKYTDWLSAITSLLLCLPPLEVGW